MSAALPAGVLQGPALLARLALATALLFAVGGALMAAGQRARRASAPERRRDWLKYGVYLAVIGALLGAGALGRAPAGMLLALVAAAGAAELHRGLRGRTPRAAWVAPAAGVALFAGLGHLVLVPAGRAPGGLSLTGLLAGPRPGGVPAEAAWYPAYALAVLLVAATDSFSQLWGRLLGRRPLCPRLSPAKTREGLAGGVLTALAVGLGAGFLAPGLGAAARAALALGTAGVAAAGDLLFSWIKRRLGLKDFSAVLPGHGGVLDRFDSLVVAAPVYYWARTLLAACGPGGF